MDLDHAQLSWEVKCVEKYSDTDEVPDAPLVNVDDIFVIPPEQQGLDTVFPRFAYSHDMYEAAKRAGSVVGASALPMCERPALFGGEHASCRQSPEFSFGSEATPRRLATACG
jgi:hypothetical protein